MTTLKLRFDLHGHNFHIFYGCVFSYEIEKCFESQASECIMVLKETSSRLELISSYVTLKENATQNIFYLIRVGNNIT